MSKEKNVPASGMELPDVASDPLDDLIMEMFLKEDLMSFSGGDDVVPEQLTDVLTKEDLDALASLGSSEELIEKITTAAGKQSKQTDRSTLRASDDSTAQTGGALDVEERTEQGGTEELAQMRHAVDTFDKQEQVLFSSEYRKTTELGRGGQGVVYLIEGQDDFSAAHALKIFKPPSGGNASSFVAEMDRMKPIASMIHKDPHDDLVDIGWFGKLDGVYAMLMRYIDGVDLRYLLQPKLMQRLKRCADEQRWEIINKVVYSVNGVQQLALQPAIAVYIIERVLRGVETLHSRDIVHGDIKPSNIMLSARGSVKIVDIGSAFEINSPPEQHYVTPAYATPEFLGKSRTMVKQSDLASVGYVLIELLSGRSITDDVCGPDESTMTICESEREELLKSKTSLPDRLEKILPANIRESENLMALCRGLIEPDLAKRFSSAAVSILDRTGTYEFNKDLILANLGVCGFQEVSQWLSDVKRATPPTTETPPRSR